MIYLIAKKLSHSFSKEIHNALADYDYDYKELEEDELEEFLKNKDFDGLNVTIPYKSVVIPYLDFISPEAEKIGAVNTIVNRDGRLYGYNTDYYGFCYQIKESGAEVKDKDALVLGRGGASKTVVSVLNDMGAKSVRLFTRDDAGREADFKDAQIIVNATPVGMYPNTGVSVIDIDAFPKCEAVLDLIYNPAKTKLISDGEKMGVKTANGLGMLVAQAKKAAEIFTDTNIDDKKIPQVQKQIADKTRNVVLVGMPGSGKSTVGKCLAKMLNREFMDSDESVANMGRTPAEIIEAEGEAAFRKIETEVLSDLCKRSGLVIATGGGCVTVEDNFDIIRQNSVVVFINRPLHKLATKGRPLSENGVDKLWEQRKELYGHFADIEIMAEDGVELTAKEIMEGLM